MPMQCEEKNCTSPAEALVSFETQHKPFDMEQPVETHKVEYYGCMKHARTFYTIFSRMEGEWSQNG